MRLIIISCILCMLVACEKKVGFGIDPELNITEYNFKNEGESIEVYSEIGMTIGISYNPSQEDDANKPVITYKRPNGGGIESIDGGWYHVSIDFQDKKILIKITAPNNTNVDREVPISIWSGNFGCKTMYKQLKQ